MSTLVTCASGFVSSAFVRALRAEGGTVHVLTRNGTEGRMGSLERVFVGDVLDRICVRKALEGVETAIHVPPMAGPDRCNVPELERQRRAHVESTRLVLEEAVAAGVRSFIFLSSAHAAGRGSERPLCEEDGGCPVTPYGQAKREAEDLVLSFSRQHPMRAVILRPPGIYGRGDRGIVAVLRRAAERNLWLPLKNVRSRHSLIFVDDLARAGLELARVLPKRDAVKTLPVFFIKDGVDYTPAEIYISICQAMHKPARLFAMPENFLWVISQFGPCFSESRFPVFRAWRLLHKLSTSERYCAHLFHNALPQLRFTPLAAAIGHSCSPQPT